MALRLAAERGTRQMAGRIFYDGLNLSLTQGTGVATYTRMLTRVVRDLGYDIGIVYTSPQTPPKDRLLREVAFFDEKQAVRTSLIRQALDCVTDQVRGFATIKPSPVDFDRVVGRRQCETTWPAQHRAVARPQSQVPRRCCWSDLRVAQNLIHSALPSTFPRVAPISHLRLGR